MLFVPWQLYCHSTTGRFAPFLFHRFTQPWRRHVTGWIQTWLYFPDEWNLMWGRDSVYTIADVPEAAFDSPEDRALAVERWGPVRSLDPEVRRMLQRTTERRMREQPLEYRFTPWAVRSGMLWLDAGRGLRRLPTFETGGYISDFHNISADYLVHLRPAQLWEDLHERGLRRTGVTLVFAMYATLVTAVYVLCAIFFGMLVLRVLTAPRGIPLAIILGTLAYTVYSARGPGIEIRRNQPFFPWLFFLLYYVPPRNPKHGVRHLRTLWRNTRRMMTRWRKRVGLPLLSG